MDATRKTVIVTDSSCDLSDEQLSRYGIRMISLRIVCQNAEYRDRIDIQEDELYELLTHELPKTSLPLPEDVSALYESLAQEGVTDVIHISISSGLSGTFNMVRMITQDFESRMRVHMVDSRTLSMGLGMMVLAAARALEEGATTEEAIERIAEAASNMKLSPEAVQRILDAFDRITETIKALYEWAAQAIRTLADFFTETLGDFMLDRKSVV